MLNLQWERIAKTAAVTLVVGSIATGASSAASATVDDLPHVASQSVTQLDFGTMEAWPFDTCKRETYARRIWANYHWFYDYDHTDNGFVNFYRVYDSANQEIGNGWASCSE